MGKWTPEGVWARYERMKKRTEPKKARQVAAYRHALGPSPECRPDDRLTARAYLARIEAVTEQCGWNRQERDALYRMRDLWRKRAAGQDARFLVAGTKRGTLPPDVRLRQAIMSQTGKS